MPGGENRGRRFPPEILRPDEVQALMGQCSPRAPTGVRNRALIATLYGAGLRVSEALALKPSDVDLQHGTVRVLQGKGGKSRTVGLDAHSAGLVGSWLDHRKARGVNGHRPLFCTLEGGEMKTAYVRALLPRLATKAGIEKRVHAHGLRHSRAAQMRRMGEGTLTIQKALGHRHLNTTEQYLRDIQPQEVIDAMKLDPWSD